MLNMTSMTTSFATGGKLTRNALACLEDLLKPGQFDNLVACARTMGHSPIEGSTVRQLRQNVSMPLKKLLM